jgi:hypothetical protein
MTDEAVQVVWVNRRSGVAHCDARCRWLRHVPIGAMRVVPVVESGRLRMCRTCLDPDVVRVANAASAAVSTGRERVPAVDADEPSVPRARDGSPGRGASAPRHTGGAA